MFAKGVILTQVYVWVNFKHMKFLILFLVLTIGVQPLQAGVCDMDMEKDQVSSHHMQDSDEGDHDCCDADEPEDSDSQPGCGNMMYCGSCNATFSPLSGVYRFNDDWANQYSLALSSDSLLPSHSTPLFRPPIT